METPSSGLKPPGSNPRISEACAAPVFTWRRGPCDVLRSRRLRLQEGYVRATAAGLPSLGMAGACSDAQTGTFSPGRRRTKPESD
jgi:hypothetical protein